MDRAQYTSLGAALSEVPDPRHRRGQRHAWPLLPTLIGAAVASGQRGLRAIGQWVAEHRAELVALLEPPRGRLPSDSTLRRALRAVDVPALEDRVARFAAGVAGAAPAPGRARVGVALDGKAARGPTGTGPPSTWSAWCAAPTRWCWARWPSPTRAARTPPPRACWPGGT